MANPQLLSGARGLIYQGTNVLAIATDITVNVRHTVRPTYVVGDMNAAAIDSLAYDVDVSVGRVIPVNRSDSDVNSTTGIVAAAGASGAPAISSIGLGLEVVLNLMTSSTDITIALQDRVTGAYIASVQGCRFSGRTQTMNANDVANERINFTGIYDAGYQGSTQGSPDNAAGNLSAKDGGIGYGV